MPKPLSHFTDRARGSLGDSVVVAVPATNAAAADTLGFSAVAGLLGIFNALGGLAVLAVGTVRASIKRFRGRAELGEGGPLESVMALFFDDRVEFYRTGWMRKSLKDRVATRPLDGVQ